MNRPDERLITLLAPGLTDRDLGGVLSESVASPRRSRSRYGAELVGQCRDVAHLGWPVRYTRRRAARAVYGVAASFVRPRHAMIPNILERIGL